MPGTDLHVCLAFSLPGWWEIKSEVLPCGVQEAGDAVPSR